MTGSIRPLLKLSSVPSSASATPYLPFLYQTRTIVQPWLRYSSEAAYQQTRQFAAAKTRPKPAVEGAVINDTKEDSVILTQNQRKPRKAAVQSDKDKPPTTRSNTFLEILQEHKSKPKIKTSHARNRAVTMTQKEHEVFERLQNMSGKKKVARTDPMLASDLNDDAKDEELAAIFDNITDKQESMKTQTSTKIQQRGVLHNDKNEKEKHSRTRIKQATNESATDQSLTTSHAPISKQHQLLPSTKPKKKTHTVELNQGEDLDALLASVKSDHKLWQLLDKHVFQDMKDLAILLKEKESSRTQDASLASKLTSKKGKVERSPPLQESHTEKPKPGEDPLTKVTNTYRPALLHSARLFRTQFPRSPYAALLLPTIKKLGPISYVLAGSTALYNELLYIRWVFYRDLNGCADLIEDMESHNILADERTSVVLQMASKTRAKEMSPDQSEQSVAAGTKKDVGLNNTQDTSGETSLVTSDTPVKSFVAGWWQLQGIEAGWVRWINAHERLAAMTRKEIQRQQEEQMLTNQARNPPPNEEVNPEISETNHSVAERQMTTSDALEPEIEILTLEDTDEPEVAAAV